MTIEDLGREAGTAARRQALRDTDPQSMLEQLHRTRRRRNREALAASLVGVVAVAGVFALTNRDPNPVNHSVGPGGASSSPFVSAVSTPCPSPVCPVGTRTYWLSMTVPVTVQLPDDFQDNFQQFSSDAFEFYRSDMSSTGVTIMENAVPVRNDSSWTRDPAAGHDAESVASWLSTRPFLSHTSLVQTRVGNRTAWRVTGQLKPGAALHGRKDLVKVAPTFVSGSTTARFRPELTGQYTVLDLPGAGVTVIWSWTLNHSASALAANQALVDGLSFG